MRTDTGASSRDDDAETAPAPRDATTAADVGTARTVIAARARGVARSRRSVCASPVANASRVRRRDVGDGFERDDLAVDEIVHRRAPRAIRAVHADDGDVFELEFGAHVREEGGERVRAVEVARRGRRGSREAERDDAAATRRRGTFGSRAGGTA